MSLKRILWAAALLIGLATPAVAQPFPPPVLQYVGQWYFGDTLRVQLAVVNWNDYWPALFAASPKLPPCGLNTAASRTWVDIYNARNRKIYGFCGLGEPSNLTQLWFGVPSDHKPRAVYITMTDRLRHRRVVSNRVTIP